MSNSIVSIDCACVLNYPLRFSYHVLYRKNVGKVQPGSKFSAQNEAGTGFVV